MYDQSKRWYIQPYARVKENIIIKDKYENYKFIIDKLDFFIIDILFTTKLILIRVES